MSFVSENGAAVARVELGAALTFTPPADRANCELLREELAISGRDSVYDSVLAGALALA